MPELKTVACDILAQWAMISLWEIEMVYFVLCECRRDVAC
jgi:hypothetical protein